MNRNTLTVAELSDAILAQMETSGFMKSTRGFYVCYSLPQALPDGRRKG